ncbi:MAG: peptidoglycan-binding protein [Oscillospiraceae bacterium]|nr:peptidoglycan-binding protein [Oscillospiraceae bacterium]
MAIKIGHASGDENRKASGGKAGDQTGGEVCIRTWYSAPWDLVLRPKDSAKAEKMARACEAACANNKVGYDQNQRNTLNEKAKAVGYQLDKITTACECDCSSLMTVCAQAAGIDIPYVYGNAPYTGNMRAQFTKTGAFEMLTASKYLTSDAYLKRGDILVRESGHTAMALGNGTSKTAEVSKVTLTVRQLEKGCEGADVKALQILLNGLGYNCGEVDGDFGSKTEAAVKKFQKAKGLTQDGVVGKKTWGELIG